MTKSVRIRRGFGSKRHRWVADILGKDLTEGYVQFDGSGGNYIDYETKEMAERARDLFEERRELATKGANPKEALGVRKVPLHNIPCGPEFELGIVFLSGALKYGSHNYRDTNILASVYYDAIMRHVKAWQEGEDFDPDSGMHHLIHAAACCFVARDSMLMGKFEDDRPLKYPNGLNMAELNKKAAKLIEGCSEPAKPFTQKDRE
jgi:hypothetical protein